LNIVNVVVESIEKSSNLISKTEWEPCILTHLY